jgi:hypothetical protein
VRSGSSRSSSTRKRATGCRFSKVNETTAFKIAALEVPELLLWVKPDSTWVWRLTELRGRTRLVTRLRARYGWEQPADALLSVLLMECGDFPMARRMLLTIKSRAERGVGARGRHPRAVAQRRSDPRRTPR